MVKGVWAPARVLGSVRVVDSLLGLLQHVTQQGDLALYEPLADADKGKRFTYEGVAI